MQVRYDRDDVMLECWGNEDGGPKASFLVDLDDERALELAVALYQAVEEHQRRGEPTGG